jgi:hypothetical protein
MHFELAKFGFRIRVKSGAMVDRLAIPGRDLEEASRKLRQMYRDCVILESWSETPSPRAAGTSFEDVVDLITPPH